MVRRRDAEDASARSRLGVPILQMHCDAEEAPMAAVVVSAIGHSVHLVLPVVGLYVPSCTQGSRVCVRASAGKARGERGCPTRWLDLRVSVRVAHLAWVATHTVHNLLPYVALTLGCAVG